MFLFYILQEDIGNIQVVTDKPEPDFAELTPAALDNAGINPDERLQATRQVRKPSPGPTVVDANKDKIVYEITFDLSDAGLAGANVVRANVLPPENLIDPIHNLATERVNLLTNMATADRQYPTQLRRNVNRYSPQITFLQLGEAQAHMSVVDARKYPMATKE